MELPLPSPSPLIPSSPPPSSSSSSSSSMSMTNDMNISNSSLLPCNEQSAYSYNRTDRDAFNQHQYQCIRVYDEQVRSKKRKLASSMQEGAHVSTIHTSTYWPQHKMDNQHCHSSGNQQEVITIKDDQILHEEAGVNEEELVIGCTTPPHVQCTCKYAAAHDHDCSIREIKDNEEPIDDNLVVSQALITSASRAGSKQGSYKGELLHKEDGTESMCGCRRIRRGPPPAPRKPKAKPKILKSNHLNFLIPPDLELFFSSTSSIYKQASHDA